MSDGPARNRVVQAVQGVPSMTEKKRKAKPKMIQAWKREPLITRVLGAIKLLYVYGLLTEESAVLVRTRFVKAAKEGVFDE